MNIKTNLIFSPKQVSKEIFPEVLSDGSKSLKNSKKLEKYNVSLREVFGLCILAIFRSLLEPKENWFFLTEPQISDDGAVASIGNHNKVTYYESVEQVYLPGNFLERKHGQSINDYILDHVSKIKDKGSEYQKNKTLFILSDVKSKNYDDSFEWQDFVRRFLLKILFYIYIFYL